MGNLLCRFSRSARGAWPPGPTAVSMAGWNNRRPAARARSFSSEQLVERGQTSAGRQQVERHRPGTLSPVDAATARRNRRWMALVLAPSLVVGALALILTVAASSKGPSVHPVDVPAGYQAISGDGYFAYAVPSSGRRARPTPTTLAISPIRASRAGSPSISGPVPPARNRRKPRPHPSPPSANLSRPRTTSAWRPRLKSKGRRRRTVTR